MGYEIRVVSNEEFDTLPYKKAKKALGLADAKNGVAYVRHTGVKELDDRTIDHEFDELIMKTSPHEEDGIRYKFWIPLIIAALKSAAVGAAVGGGVTAIKGGDWGDIGKGALGGAKWGAIGGGLGGLASGAGGAMAGSANGAISSVGGGLSKVGSLMGGGGVGSASKSTLGSLATNPGMVTGVGGNSLAQGLVSGAQAGTSNALSGFAGSVGAGATTGLSSSVAGSPSGASAQASGSPLEGFNVSAPATSPTGIGAGIGAQAAPAGQSLVSKFGDFTYDRAAQFAGNELKTLAGNAIAPSEQGSLFPEYRTPVSGYGSEGALSRFAPSLSAPDSYVPLSQQEYESGLSNLYSAKQTRTSDLFSQDAFRGQDPAENTALAEQLSGLNQGFDLELGQYNKDIDSENSYRKYASIKNDNGLTDDLMSQYIALADKSDEEISRSVTNTPEEFRQIFQGLTMRV